MKANLIRIQLFDVKDRISARQNCNLPTMIEAKKQLAHTNCYEHIIYINVY